MAGLPEILESFALLACMRRDAPHTCDVSVGFRNVVGETGTLEFRVHSTALMGAPYLLRLLTDVWREGQRREIYFDVATMTLHQLVTREHIELVLALLYRDKRTIDSLRVFDPLVISSPDSAAGEQYHIRMLVLLEFSWMFGFSLLTELAAAELCLHHNTTLVNYTDALCAPHLRALTTNGAAASISEKESSMLTHFSNVHEAALQRMTNIVLHYWNAPRSESSTDDDDDDDFLPVYKLNVNALLSLVLRLAQRIPYMKLLNYAFHVQSFGQRRLVICNLDAVLEELIYEYLTHAASLRGELRALACELAECIDYSTWSRHVGYHLLNLHYMQLFAVNKTQQTYRKRVGLRVAIVILNSSVTPVVSSCVPCTHAPAQHLQALMCSVNRDLSVTVSAMRNAFYNTTQVLEWTSTCFRDQENPHLINWNMQACDEPAVVRGSFQLQTSDVNVLYFGVA